MEGGDKLFPVTPEGQKAAIADCQLAKELLGEWPSPLSVAVVASPDSIYGLAVCEDCMFMLLYGHLDCWEGEINCK
jgi:hypothetical protein